MQDQITEALKSHGADYVEIRLEEGQGTHIRYRGKDLEEIGRTSSLGGNVRAIAGGGWGFVCFNNPDDLKEKVAHAVRHARVVGGEAVHLSTGEPRVDIVPPNIHRDPRTVPLKEKKRVLDEYVDIIWSTPGIQSSVVGYGDGYRKVTFANSEGTYIEQEKIETTLRIAPMARDGTEVQQAGISLGASGDYSWVETLHDEVQVLANRAVELLKAPQVKGGEYPVILDPCLLYTSDAADE